MVIQTIGSIEGLGTVTKAESIIAENVKYRLLLLRDPESAWQGQALWVDFESALPVAPEQLTLITENGRKLDFTVFKAGDSFSIVAQDRMYE